MGVDYSVNIVPGIRFDVNYLEQFKVEIPGKWHMEERYCSKTGRKLDDVKIVDEKPIIKYKLPNSEDMFSCQEDFLEHLADEIGVNFQLSIDIDLNYNEDSFILHFYDYKSSDDDLDVGRLSTGGGMIYDDQLKQNMELMPKVAEYIQIEDYEIGFFELTSIG